MYRFEQMMYSDLKSISEFNRLENKNVFTTIEWLEYLKELKKIVPVVLKVRDQNDVFVGYCTAGIVNICGVLKIFGSPFWGWIGQHMGFDLVQDVDKAALVDDLIDYVIGTLHCNYFQMTDIKFGYDDIEKCSHHLIPGERYNTCYIDLTLSEEQLFKNFKNGYRTCVRKFEKLGGTIEEDYSDAYIDEHHQQLQDVFGRKKMKVPNYRKKMKLAFSFLKKQDMVLSVKAMNEEGKNIASSYYIGNQNIAMFASNASFTDYLNYNANQALMWHAMRYWKSQGCKLLDMGGSGSYKENFGATWDPKPIMIYSKHKWEYMILIGLKKEYGKVVRMIGNAKDWIKTMVAKPH